MLMNLPKPVLMLDLQRQNACLGWCRELGTPVPSLGLLGREGRGPLPPSSGQQEGLAQA